jgi:hypothetical protein
LKRLVALLTCGALVMPALAEDVVKDSFKKVEKGTGQLFQGMGQEIKKAGDSISKGAKKDEKKAAKDKEERK